MERRLGNTDVEYVSRERQYLSPQHLEMKVLCSFETSGKPSQVTRHHIPEDLNSLNQSVDFWQLKTSCIFHGIKPEILPILRHEERKREQNRVHKEIPNGSE